MTEQGYIKLYRTLQNNVFYKNSEAIHLWVHLLFSASFKDNVFYYKNTKINLKKGQLMTGRKKISLETGINESKIFRLLKLFENEHLIEQQTNHQYSIITILSYDKAIDNEQRNEQGMNNERTTNEQRMNTTKELIKKDKKEKKDIYSEKNKKSYGEFANVLLTDEQYKKLSEIYCQHTSEAIETLSTYIESSGKKYKSHYAVLGKHNWVYKKLVKEEEEKNRRNYF